MIRILLAAALLTIVTVLCIYPWVAAAAAGCVILLLVPAMIIAPVRETIVPAARVIRKRKTGRRFQRPVVQRV